MKKTLITILFILFPGICFSADFFYSKVRFIPDGDTIVLKNKRVIRYIGIDSPETNHKTSNPQPFALMAKNYNKELVLNKTLKIVPGDKKSDKYKRILAYVYLPDGRMVNKLVLEKGLAWVYNHKDNSRYFNDFLLSQRQAMNSNSGLWEKILQIDLPVRANPNSLKFHSVDCKNSGKKSFIEKNPFQAFYKGYSPSRKCLANIFKYKN